MQEYGGKHSCIMLYRVVFIVFVVLHCVVFICCVVFIASYCIVLYYCIIVSIVLFLCMEPDGRQDSGPEVLFSGCMTESTRLSFLVLYF